MTRLPKIEWLVVIFDHAAGQRLRFKTEHLATLRANINKGVVTSGGPLFEDAAQTKPFGSALTVKADSKAEVVDLLKSDIYAEKNVWNFDTLMVHPCAPRFRSSIEWPKSPAVNEGKNAAE